MSNWLKAQPYLERISNLDSFTTEHLSAIQVRPDTASMLSPPAIESWSKFQNGSNLNSTDKKRLEEIVLPNGLRPAFDVQDGSVAALPDPWTSINSHEAFLKRCIAAVGRIDVPGHALLQYAGTGCIVGEALLITNRHVAEVFCQAGSTPVIFTPGITPAVDLKQEVGSVDKLSTAISSVVYISPDFDVALLRLASAPAGVVPVSIAADTPGSVQDRLAAIIGYPALESDVSTQEILQQIQIFRGIFDKKRVQPGRLIGINKTISFGQNVDALAHDCSTLGGNSGSALVDVESESIVGIHFGGEYLVANYAIPTWSLAAKTAFRNAGVRFA